MNSTLYEKDKKFQLEMNNYYGFCHEICLKQISTPEEFNFSRIQFFTYILFKN